MTFYVATDGSDEWSGRLSEPNPGRTDGPFASIARAQRAVRALKKQGPDRSVRVIVREGEYELRSGLVFTPEDSAPQGHSITYQAEAGATVILRGTRAIRGWRPWRDGVYRADLKAQGLGDVQFHQVFYRDKRQVLARHPNLDPQHPRTGGCIYVEDRAPEPRRQLIYAEGDVPFDQWRDISQVEVVSTYCQGWNFAITPIVSVDTHKRLITVRRVRRTFERNNRFFVQNVLGALDARGEWFHDRKTGTLYFYPPEGKVADGEVRVPVVDHLITVRGTIPYPHGYLNVKHHGTREQFEMPPDVPPERPVAGLVFTGFRLDGARQDGIRMIGARNCAVVACRVTNVGGVGINLGGVTPAYDEVGNPRVVPAEGVFGGVGGAGQDLLFNDPCQGCVVRGNDVWSVGSDGIFLYGTQNVAENNHVYDTGLFDKDCACINLWGERNAARRNELHDAPRNAVFLKGTDNVVELNDIHNTMLETCDGGAIRMCQRNLTLRGNVIRHNRIVDTLGYGYPRGSNAYQSPYYSWGVYLDDYTCGTEVIGNVIVRTGRGGVMLHGGSDNVVANNVIVDAGGYAVEVAPIREPVTGNLVRRNIIVCDGDRAFVYRCTRWLEGAVHFALNLVWPRGAPARVDLGRGGARYDDWETWQDAGLDEGSKVADPRFKDADDYRLRDDSPALDMGFAPIPVGDIGCYPDEARATWPLEVDPDLVREDPVLYVAPVRPLDEDFELDLVGKPPRHGDVIAFPKAPIVVTDEVAASGQHSLKIVDAPGLPRVWQPRIFYPFRYSEGTVRFSCELRLDGNRPPRIYVDPRQYSDTEDVEYFSGPMFFITPGGELQSVDRKMVAQVPLDEWFKIEVTMILGDNAPAVSELVLTAPGAEPRRLKLPHGSPRFRRLERVVISSVGDTASVFYLDNVRCAPLDD